MKDENYIISEHNQSPHLYSKEAGKWSLLLQLSVLSGFLIPFGGLIAPMVIWHTKKAEFDLVEVQGKEVLNLIITYAIAFVVSFVLSFIIIGILGFFLMGIHSIVVILIGCIRANERKFYRYPYIFRFIK